LASKIGGTLGNIHIGDGEPCRVMGAINLSANSFYRGSIKTKPPQISETALRMQEEGADFIDIGARSTAPYRTSEISIQSEVRVIGEATKLLTSILKIPLSIDTTRIEPARAGFKNGATILNDVYGSTQKNAVVLARLVARNSGSYITVAHESRPKRSHDPIRRVKASLETSLAVLCREGVEQERISIDPGIGFFRDSVMSNVDWNCTVLDQLGKLRDLGHPIVVGVSRKRFIGMLDSERPPEGRLPGSLSAAAIAVYNGVHVIRTHDVAETVQAVRVASKLRSAREQKSLSDSDSAYLA
jgi:dihydropteroate synthase